MKTYIYDGSFEGLMTAIHLLLTQHENCCSIAPKDRYEPDLFSVPVEVETDNGNWSKAIRSIKEMFSSSSLSAIYYAYLSEEPDIENRIYRYIQFGQKVKNNIDNYLTDERVIPIHRACRKVAAERHRMLGLLRFRELNGGIYYAPFEPDHNIVSILAPHFAGRMRKHRWIIHDLKRRVAAVYNTNDWVLVPLELDDVRLWTYEEVKYQRLWQEFFDSIAIENRINPKLQRSHMPVRYWKHLIEMDK